MRPLPLVSLAVLVTAACQAPEARPTPVADADAITTPQGHVVARIERAPYDETHHVETCKVFHHVFAPDGRLLTKGLGGEFEHHRALFFGFNQTTWNGKKLDFWHMHAGETQRFVAYAEDAARPGWQTAGIAWCAKGGDEVLHERRSLRARDIDDSTTALDFHSELVAGEHAVRLGGDPQHAGQQFRALQAFAEKDAPKAHYLRPASAQAHDNDVWTGCAWIAQVLPLPDGPVTVLRLEHASNPGPATWSTRDYGRFGAMFAIDLPAHGTVTADWTYVIALGEKDAAWCQATAEREHAAAPAAAHDGTDGATD